MQQQDMFYDPSQPFDLFELQPDLVKLADLEGKTLMIHDYSEESSQYGPTLRVTVQIIEDEHSFETQPVDVLISSTILMRQIQAVRDPRFICFTVGRQFPKSGGQAYYLSIETPKKILKLIQAYRTAFFTDNITAKNEQE